MRKPTLTAAIALLYVAGIGMLRAGEAPPMPENSEEIIEQILELRQRLDTLLQSLPPELRQELERRWLERRPAGAVEPAAEISRDASLSPPPESAATAMTSTQERKPIEPDRSEAGAPAVGPDVMEPESAPATAEACNTLTALDSNDDHVVSGADRYWRYLRLWVDDGDGELEEDELKSLYDLGIHEIAVDLGFYKTRDGASGDISLDAGIRLQLVGKGPAGGGSGLLVLEAGRLARGGRHSLIDTSGETLTGFQLLTAATAIETSDGARWPLLCR